MISKEATLLLVTLLTVSAAFIPSASQNPSSTTTSSLYYVDKSGAGASAENPFNDNGPMSLRDRIAKSGAASAAAMAAAVNRAVAMKPLEAPSYDKSYVALDKSQNEIDEEGLPMSYDKDLIEKFWSKEKGALNQRWGYFVKKAVPYLTKMMALILRDGKINDEHIPDLSRQARIDLQDLGPTFIKAGQMMSVRPDVLPQSALDELSQLQDAVVPFDTTVAVECIERELGAPLGEYFTSISEEPIAAASLAQVYLATLNDGKETRVAIKVQRPSMLGVVSKDLYVLRRAAEVFQGLAERFAPKQKTDYVALLNEWAVGFYTELDFLNEAKNQAKLRNNLIEKGVKGVTVPKVYEELCTRRLLVSEWMDGKKLSDLDTESIARLTPMAQEAFLTQMFETGFFHADPHPGNLLLLDEPTEEGAEIALIDCGLMASINEQDRDHMVSAVIHLANKDYVSLVDDFINLRILPKGSNRAAIVPLMDKALSPYVVGGGMKKYEARFLDTYGMKKENLSAQVGGFQAMTQDLLIILNDIPFSIPPYFAILGRAIVALEGIALSGDPGYGIIMEAYPFIARKLLREDRPEVQAALQEVLYSGDSSNSRLKLSRLLTLLNNAAGQVATKEGATFVDLDGVPEDGIDFKQGLKFLLSDNAESLRNLLEKEVDSIVDIMSRQILRKGIDEVVAAMTPRPPSIPFLSDLLPEPPKLDEIPHPVVLAAPNGGGTPIVKMMTMKELKDTAAPALSQEEELFALGISDASSEFFGEEFGAFTKGESVLSTKSAEIVLAGLRSGVITGSQTDSVNPETIQATVDGASNLLALVQSSSGGRTQMEKELTGAIDNLNDNEKSRLDHIATEIVERAIKRIRSRCAKMT